MGLLDTIQTKSAEWLARNGYYKLAYLWGYGSNSATVNDITALNCSVVFACTRVIAETAASLPLQVFREQSGGGRVAATDHPLYPILHHAYNPFMTAMEGRETQIAHAVTRGNSYARIARRSGRGGEILGLYPLDPGSVEVKIEGGDIYYDWTQESKPKVRLTKDEVFPVHGLGFDGIHGYSVIRQASTSIGLSLTAERLSRNYLASGGRAPGLLEYEGKWKTAEERDNFLENWRSQYESVDTAGKTPLMPTGMKWQSMGINPNDMQFLETRQFMVSEICRWFRVPPHLVQDLMRSTNNNIEHQSLEFVMHTLRPWLVRFEQAASKWLLTEAERKAGYYVEHNIDGLLRGDYESRTKGYATLLQNGVLSINEVRAMENFNPIEGGEDHHIQLNMQNITGDPTASQQAALVKVGGNKQ